MRLVFFSISAIFTFKHVKDTSESRKIHLSVCNFFFYVFDIKSHIVGWSRFVTIYLCTWNCLYSLPLIDFFSFFFFD